MRTLDVELHVGIALTKVQHEARQQLLAGAAGVAHAQHAGVAALDEPTGLHRLVELQEQRLHALQKGLARLREVHAAGAALEELHAQLLLQLADALAQRRLRHVQFVGRTGEALLLRHRQKTSQMPQFHDLRPLIKTQGI